MYVHHNVCTYITPTYTPSILVSRRTLLDVTHKTTATCGREQTFVLSSTLQTNHCHLQEREQLSVLSTMSHSSDLLSPSRPKYDPKPTDLPEASFWSLPPMPTRHCCQAIVSSLSWYKRPTLVAFFLTSRRPELSARPYSGFHQRDAVPPHLSREHLSLSLLRRHVKVSISL